MNLAGQTLGNYYVEGPAERKGKNPRWVCVCLTCGERYRIYESYLLSKNKRRGHCRACWVDSTTRLARGCRYCGHRNSQNKPLCKTCADRAERNGICPECSFPRYTEGTIPLTKDGSCLCPGPYTRVVEEMLNERFGGA